MNKHSLDVRKLKIMEILKRDQVTTMGKMSTELNVTTRTLRSDIAYLKEVYPFIKTKRGGNDGGIYIDDDQL